MPTESKPTCRVAVLCSIVCATARGAQVDLVRLNKLDKKCCIDMGPRIGRLCWYGLECSSVTCSNLHLRPPNGCSSSCTNLSVALFSNCPSSLWLDILAPFVADGSHSPTMLNIGANKGYDVRSFLERFDPTWHVTGQTWHRALRRHNATFQLCGACGACSERALWRASSGPSAGTVIAVEAEPRNAQLLVDVFDELGARAHGGTVVHAAATAPNAPPTAYLPNTREVGLETAVPNIDVSQAMDGGLEGQTVVPTTTVDQLLSTYGLGQVDMCLIDTEGQDHAVVRGAERALRARALKIIAFEYGGLWCFRQPNGACQRLEPIIQMLAGLGYSCWWLGNEGDVARVDPSCTDVSTRFWSNIGCVAEPTLISKMEELETMGAKAARRLLIKRTRAAGREAKQVVSSRGRVAAQRRFVERRTRGFAKSALANHSRDLRHSELVHAARPFLVILVGPYVKKDNGNYIFNNYGDKLMHDAAQAMCLDWGVDCSFINIYDSPMRTKNLLKNAGLRAAGIFFMPGYYFSLFFGEKRVAEWTVAVEWCKSEGLYIALLPQAVGPFSQDKLPTYHKFFGLVDEIMLRDKASIDAVVSVGAAVQPKMVHDMVFSSYRPRISVSKPQQDSPRFCFSISAKTMKQSKSRSGFEKSVIEIITQLTHNATLLLIPHDSNDRSLIPKFIRNAHSKNNTRVSMLSVGSEDVSQVEKEIASCDVVLTMRFHVLVLAARAATPVAVISWAPKYEDMLHQLGLDTLVSLQSVQNVVQTVWKLYDNRTAISKLINMNGLKITRVVDHALQHLRRSLLFKFQARQQQHHAISSDTESDARLSQRMQLPNFLRGSARV